MQWWKNLVAIFKYFSACLDAITKAMDSVSTNWPTWPNFDSPGAKKTEGERKQPQPEVSAAERV